MSFGLMKVAYELVLIHEDNGSSIPLEKDLIKSMLRRHSRVSKSRSWFGGVLWVKDLVH